MPSPSGNTRLAPLLGFALLAALLVIVYVAVLEKRFASGEIYPHYSTLRSDPLGARALHDSLAALPQLEVNRNRKSLMSIDTLDGDTALWLCGLSRGAFDRLRAPEDSPVLRAVREDGARLLITLNPRSVPRKFDLAEEEEETAFEEWWDERERIRREREKGDEEASEPGGDSDGETGAGGKDADKDNAGEKPAEEKDEIEETANEESKENDAPEDEPVSDEDDDKEEEEMRTEMMGPRLTELLEIDLEIPDEFERPDEGWEARRGENPLTTGLPGALPHWRSQYRFDTASPEWHVAATVEGEPVVVERKFGAGTVILATDSYFASNEALWRESQPDFLVWLLGGKSRIVFDETIHGTVESGGTMKIIRRYRFHGFFFGLAIFVALLAWKSGTSLSPGSEAIERGLVDGGTSVAGEEAGAGMTRLLRRNVPRKQLLRTCLQVWRSSSGQRHRAENDGQRQAIDTIVAAHERDPKATPALEAFRRISYVLSHPDEFRDSKQA